MAGGWRSNGTKTTRTVFGPHPWSLFEMGVDALFGLGMAGENGMNRSESQSATNNSRYMGDLGPLQPFNNIPAGTNGRIPAKPSSLPSSAGASSSANPILDLLR